MSICLTGYAQESNSWHLTINDSISKPQTSSSGNIEYGFCTDSAANAYVAYLNTGPVRFTPKQLIVSKYNSCNENEWTFQYKLDSFPAISIVDMFVDSLQNVLLFLQIENLGYRDREFSILKMSPQGNTIWCKKYRLPFSYSTVDISESKNTIILNFASRINFKAQLIEINLNGDIQLSKAIESALKITITPAGEFIVANDEYLTLLDKNWQEKWAYKLTNPSGNSFLRELKLNDSSIFWVEQTYTSSSVIDDHISIFKFDISGQLQWKKAYFNIVTISKLVFLKDNSFIALGNGYENNQYLNLGIIKFNEDGDIDWHKNLPNGYSNSLSEDFLLKEIFHKPYFAFLLDANTKEKEMNFIKLLDSKIEFSCAPFLDTVTRSVSAPNANTTSTNFLPNKTDVEIKIIPQQVSKIPHTNQSDIICYQRGPGLPLHLGNDTTLCPGESLLLQTGLPGKHYWTDDSINGKNFIVNEAGIYNVSVDGNCSHLASFDTIEVQYYAQPDLTLNTIENILVGDTLLLELITNEDSGFNVQWFVNDDSAGTGLNFRHVFKTPGVYQVRMKYSSANQCVFYRDVQIEVKSEKLEFPNIFTPNGDGINEVFKPLQEYHLPLSIEIYNRYGTRVASCNQTGWNGTIKGQAAAEGVYFYAVTASDFKTPLKGSFTLMR